MHGRNKLYTILTMFLLLLSIGTVGYSLLLRIAVLDALYMTVITISTVGYKEVTLMTPAAKVFSIFVIFMGLGLVGYMVSTTATYLLEGAMRDTFRKRRLRKRMEEMQNHIIICGGGETGENVIRQFEKSQAPFLVIDNDPERIADLAERGIIAIQGDAEEERVLEEAGIHRARGLISTLSTDADNVFTVLTARYLNPDLFIISRAIEEHAHDKLLRAGADRTISPNEIGGRRMAALMLRPTVISFLDMMTHVGEVILDLEDVELSAGSELDGLRLKEARIPDKTGLIVMALHKGGAERMVFNPGPDEILKPGDSMIVLGTEEQIAGLKSLAGSDAKKP